jgi:hypothetical protein
MGGLAVLVICAAYVGVALWLSLKMIKPRWGKVIALIVFVLLPTADGYYGRIKLKQMCAEEGGLKRYKTVEGVESFYGRDLPPSAQWLAKDGYKFVEGRGLGGKPMRLSLRPDGKLLEETNLDPTELKSRYRYEHSGGDFGAGFARDDYLIRDVQTNEVLASHVNISYAGGWAERFLAQFSDAGRGFVGACQLGSDQFDIVKFITGTLKSTK